MIGATIQLLSPRNMRD